MTKLNKSIRFSLFFLCLLIMVVFDIYFDFQNSIPVKYLLFETLIFFLSLVGFYFFVSRALALQEKKSQKIQKLEGEIIEKQNHVERLTYRVNSYKDALAHEIEQTFKRWAFTKAESQVAALLLKGLSLKEIAEVRNCHENTVRSQCTSIYKKSKLNNRSQLSSYFLDDLI